MHVPELVVHEYKEEEEEEEKKKKKKKKVSFHSAFHANGLTASRHTYTHGHNTIGIHRRRRSR
jgi:hypothetical protein